MAAAGPGIPRVDPKPRTGRLGRALDALTRTAAARWFGINVAARVDPYLLRASGGYISLGLLLPTVNLTTTGARSGEPRTATLLYFSDGDDVILIASSFGRDRHPAWYHNLKAHPHARLERAGRAGDYTSTEVQDEDERRRLFAMADLVYPGYAEYRARTDVIGRRIPIMRLTPSG